MCVCACVPNTPAASAPKTEWPAERTEQTISAPLNERLGGYRPHRRVSSEAWPPTSWDSNLRDTTNSALRRTEAALPPKVHDALRGRLPAWLGMLTASQHDHPLPAITHTLPAHTL